MKKEKGLPMRGIVDYGGFHIDEEISDHSVLLINAEHGVRDWHSTTHQAKLWVNGFNFHKNLKPKK